MSLWAWETGRLQKPPPQAPSVVAPAVLVTLSVGGPEGTLVQESVLGRLGRRGETPLPSAQRSLSGLKGERHHVRKMLG